MLHTMLGSIIDAIQEGYFSKTNGDMLLLTFSHTQDVALCAYKYILKYGDNAEKLTEINSKSITICISKSNKDIESININDTHGDTHSFCTRLAWIEEDIPHELWGHLIDYIICHA